MKNWAIQLAIIVFASAALAFTLPAPRETTPKELFDAASKERWIEQTELTATNSLVGKSFKISTVTNTEAVDFRIDVESPLSIGVLNDGLLMLSDGKGQTNFCPIAFSQDGDGALFRAFTVAKQWVPFSKFQVWFYLQGEEPVKAKVYWLSLGNFSPRD
jgi:hypothetical protein